MKRILVPLGGHDSDEAIVPLIGQLARQSGATVRLLRVYPAPDLIMQSPDFPGKSRVVAYVDQQMAALKGQGLDYLREVESQLDGAPVEAVVRFGDPTQETLAEAEAFGADLVAVATSRRSRLRSVLSSSVAERIARRASAPVLTLRV